MPIYPGRRPKTWRVTVYVSPKQHEWIVEGSKKDARAFEAARAMELRSSRSTIGVSSGVRFSDFVTKHYGPHAVLHLGARTWGNTRQYQVLTLANFFGHTPLERVGEKVEAFKAHEIARGVLASTVNHHLKVLRVILRFAKDEKVLAEVPRIRPLPQPPSTRVHFWTAGEVSRLYASALADPMRIGSFVTLLQFLLETGVRRTEAIMAEWSWVDWPTTTLRIPATKDWAPKSKKPREVPLGPGLVSALRRLPLPREGRIFRDHHGEPYSKFPVKLWYRTTKAAGLSGGPHTTRHTFASHFLAGQPDLGLLAAILGHSTLRITEMYAHLLPERLERARGVVSLGPETLAKPLAIAARSRNR